MLALGRIIKGATLGCLLWFSLPLGAIPPQVQNGERAPGLVWPNVGPCQHLGHSGWYAAEVPVDVVEAASGMLAGDPDDWAVFHVKNYAGQQKEIVWLHDPSLRSFICLVEPGRWVRLNEPRSLPVINEIMGPSLTLLGDLKDRVKLAVYLQDFVSLYQGNCRFILCQSFWRGLQGSPGPWLRGTEEKPEVLQALCRDPVVAGPEDALIIRCNFLNYWGAVEQWTFHAKAGKSLEVTRVAVEIIRQNGTFTVGLVGD